MAEELKTRLTNKQIADLAVNLPLADLKGTHADHRLKEISDEIQLTYNLSPSFIEEYVYVGALAHAAYYVPASGTIVMNALLDGVVDANNKFIFGKGGSIIKDAFVAAECASKNGMTGPFYCEGTLGFYNFTGGAVDLELYGIVINF